MPQELIYTSVPKGLKSGSSGFSTVLHTVGMAPNLIGRLESLSGYTYLFPPDSSQAGLNPAVLAHYKLELAGRDFHVISRNAPYGMDYTGRSNNLAHHIVFQTNEALPPCGPAVLLQKSMEKDFTGLPRVIPFARELSFAVPRRSLCSAWQRTAGDAGWAAKLAETAQTQQLAVVLYQPGMDTMALISEALHLLPENERWQVTFSTCFTGTQAGLKCQWRFIPLIPGERPKIPPRSLVLDLTQPLGSAPDSPLAALARTGKLPVPPKPIPQEKPHEVPVASQTPVVPSVPGHPGLKEPPTRPMTDYAPKSPMEIPVASYDPERTYTPSTKQNEMVWWIMGIAGLLIFLIVGAMVVSYTMSEYNAKFAHVNHSSRYDSDEDEDDDRDRDRDEDRTEYKSPRLDDEIFRKSGPGKLEEETKEDDDEKDEEPEDKDPEDEEVVGKQDLKVETPSKKEKKQADPPKQKERKIHIQIGTGKPTSETLDGNTYCLENKSDVVVRRLDDDSEIQEEDGWYSLNGKKVFKLADNLLLKFDNNAVKDENSVLDEFYENYKIVVNEWQYALEIDGSEMFFKDGKVAVQENMLCKLELKDKDKDQKTFFQFNIKDVSVENINRKVLIYNSEAHAFEKTKDCPDDLLHEFCNQCKFVTNDDLVRVPVYDPSDHLVSLEIPKEWKGRLYTMTFSLTENCLGGKPLFFKDGKQLSEDEDNKFNGIKPGFESSRTLTLQGPRNKFKGFEVHFEKVQEKPEDKRNELTLDQIEQKEFWYNIEDPSPAWLPMTFKNVDMSYFGGDFELSRKTLLENVENDRNEVLEIEIEDDAFRMIRKERMNPLLKIQIQYTQKNGKKDYYIFFTEPQYEQRHLVVTEKLNTENSDNPDQKLKLADLGSPSNATIILQTDKKDNNKTEPIEFNITVHGLTVTFESTKEFPLNDKPNEKKKLKLKAAGRILKDGTPVLEFTEKDGDWQDDKFLEKFKGVEFNWEIIENGHLRATSEKKKK